jgi:hypothetical protein
MARILQCFTSQTVINIRIRKGENQEKMGVRVIDEIAMRTHG